MILSLKNLLFWALASCRNPNAICRLIRFNCAFNTFLFWLKSSVFPPWEKILASNFDWRDVNFPTLSKNSSFQGEMEPKCWWKAMAQSSSLITWTSVHASAANAKVKKGGDICEHFHKISSWTKGWIHYSRYITKFQIAQWGYLNAIRFSIYKAVKYCCRGEVDFTLTWLTDLGETPDVTDNCKMKF